jgi:hypothetical protein
MGASKPPGGPDCVALDDAVRLEAGVVAQVEVPVPLVYGGEVQ